MTIGCVACGAADHLDAYEEPEAEPQAVSKLRTCPQFGWWLLLPKSLPVGATTEVLVNVSDPDTPDDHLSFAWSSNSGAFSELARPRTRYTCDSPGRQVLTLVATDDSDCGSVLNVDVNCFNP